MVNKLGTLTLNDNQEPRKALDHQPRLTVFLIHSYSMNKRGKKQIELQLNQG